MLELAIAVEDENLARLGVADVDVVLVIDGDTLRSEHRILALLFALDELVLLLDGIEDMNALRARIGNDDAAARVFHHAVRTNEEVEIGLAHDQVENLGEEAGLGANVAISLQAALEGELASLG